MNIFFASLSNYDIKDQDFLQRSVRLNCAFLTKLSQQEFRQHHRPRLSNIGHSKTNLSINSKL